MSDRAYQALFAAFAAFAALAALLAATNADIYAYRIATEGHDWQFWALGGIWLAVAAGWAILTALGVREYRREGRR